MPDSDMQPSPIAETVSPPVPSARCSSFSVVAMAVPFPCAVWRYSPAHGGHQIHGATRVPTNPADSPILGTLYSSDAMRAVFDERAYFQRMLDVEAALARVQARLGIIPADAAEAITRAARFENLRTEELAASARNVGYPVVGMVAGLSRDRKSVV